MDILAISISDTAKTLGCGRTSIYQMIRDGRLKTIKIGRRHLVTTSSVRRVATGEL